MPVLEIIKSTYQLQGWASDISGKLGDRMRSRFLCDYFTLDSPAVSFTCSKHLNQSGRTDPEQVMLTLEGQATPHISKIQVPPQMSQSLTQVKNASQIIAQQIPRFPLHCSVDPLMPFRSPQFMLPSLEGKESLSMGHKGLAGWVRVQPECTLLASWHLFSIVSQVWLLGTSVSTD